MNLQKLQRQSLPVYAAKHVFDKFGKLYVFGGRTVGNVLADSKMTIWHVNSDVWTVESLSPSSTKVPEARCVHSMVYRTRKHSIIVFGGYSAGTLSDMWEYDIASNKWNQIITKKQVARFLAGMAYYEQTDCLFLVGGFAEKAKKNNMFMFSFETMDWHELECELPCASEASENTYQCHAEIVNHHQMIVIGNEFAESYMYLYDIWNKSWHKVIGVEEHVGMNPICCYDRDKVIVFQSNKMFLYQLSINENKLEQRLKKNLLACQHFTNCGAVF